MAKYTIILNPVSGRGSAADVEPQIVAFFEKHNVDFKIWRTERMGHAETLAQKAIEDGSEVLVAAGGDGTVNEVLNGIIRTKLAGKGSATLGVIGIGRGNDMAFGLELPHDVEQNCQFIIENNTRTIDVGFVKGGDFPDGRYFANGLGIGFDAVVGFVAAKFKRLSGFMAYAVAAIKTMFIYRNPPQLRIEVNGKEYIKNALMVSIMNGPRLGGGFFMAPEALLDDGYLDICLVDHVKMLSVLNLIGKFTKGTQAEENAVEMIRTKNISVYAQTGSIPCHADGETICEQGQSLTVEILPKTLDIIVRKEAK